MKKKRDTSRFSPIAMGVIAIGVVAILLLSVFLGLDYTIKNWAGYVWDKKSAESFLRATLPADATNIEFGSHQGRGGRLVITFQDSYASTDAFVSQFCDGDLHQGYDPFNAIDTRIKPSSGAYLIKMSRVDYFGKTVPVNYYSYSPNTPETLYGIRCVTIVGFAQGADPYPSQLEILVDKALSDVALVRIEAPFNCYKCELPEDPTPTKTRF